MWLDVKRLLAARSCWIDCMSLDPETQEDGVCLVRPDEGMDSISQVDESVPAGFLWKAWIHMLASNDYVPEKNMFAHPFDWRLPPELLEQRDRSFSRLQRKIELVVEEQEDDVNVLDPGVTLVALSLGNLYVQYFFKYLETELGNKGLEKWVEKHVYALVMAGAPYLGAVGPIRAVLVGDPNGLPITYEESRDLMLTFGSMPWMFPHEIQSKSPSKLYSMMNHGETHFPVNVVEVEMQDGSVISPKNKNVLNGFFRDVDGDGRLKTLQNNLDRYYKNDRNIFDGKVLTPFVPPKGIDHVISVYVRALICFLIHLLRGFPRVTTTKTKHPCLTQLYPRLAIIPLEHRYGVNIPTPVGARYKEQSTKGFFDEVELITNDGGKITSSLTSRSAIPKARSYRARQSGDGTVPYVVFERVQSYRFLL